MDCTSLFFGCGRLLEYLIEGVSRLIGIDWVYDFNIVQWAMLFVLIGYVVAWIGGVAGFRDVDRRFFRIPSNDDYYVGSLGDILMVVRNVVGFLILLISFMIIT